MFFFATFIRSAFGFGEALVAVPLLALVMPIDVAAPVAVLLSITIAAVVVAQDWRQIHFRSANTLFLATVFGIPLGLLLLAAVDGRLVKGVLAVVIVAFSAWCLLKRQPAAVSSVRPAWPFGFVAGVLGGAYGMNGPPLVIYGTLQRWSPQHFRATLQGYFLPASVLIMAGYWFAGLWTSEVTRYYLLSLPVMIPAIFLGRAANRRMRGPGFIFTVHLGLILTGLVLFVQAAKGL